MKVAKLSDVYFRITLSDRELQILQFGLDILEKEHDNIIGLKTLIEDFTQGKSLANEIYNERKRFADGLK